MGLPTGLPMVPPGQPVQPVQQQWKKADYLLFAMREDSSIAKKKVYCYTRCQQCVETKQTKY
ncbi:hypothetical protein IW148_005069 [Coemansia sp. RSA 1199]|nr:hypothetical protein IW148_005069 [Coemansia sp. RSA 1199]